MLSKFNIEELNKINWKIELIDQKIKLIEWTISGNN